MTFISGSFFFFVFSDSCFLSALSGRSVCASLAVTAYRREEKEALKMIKSRQDTVVECVVRVSFILHISVHAVINLWHGADA